MEKTTLIRVSQRAYKKLKSMSEKQTKEFGRQVTAPEIIDNLLFKNKR